MLERVCWWEHKLVQPPWRIVQGFLKETENRHTIWSSNPTPVHISRENHTLERYMYPIVHCSTIYNRQDMGAILMSINRGMGKEDALFIYNGILLSLGKEWNNSIFSNMDGYLTKWSKTGRERQISYDIIYMWHLKKWIYFQNRTRLTVAENKLMVTKRERWGRGINKEFGIDIYTLLYIK